MNTILVPVDFTPASRNAADYAALLAKQSGAELFLLHVYTEPVPVLEGGVPIATMGVDLRREQRVRIDAETKRLAQAYGVTAKGEAIAGFRGDTIREKADELGAAMICLGRKAKKYNALFGSTILKAVRKTSVPVLVVPEGTVYQPPKRVVLAVDFREMIQQHCVAPLFSLVKAAGASLTVLHIEKNSEGLSPDEVPEKLQLGRVLSRITYVYETVTNENIGEGVLKFVDRHATDLLVMVAHRHHFVERLFGETHTKPVVFALNIPLLILHNEPA